MRKTTVALAIVLIAVLAAFGIVGASNGKTTYRTGLDGSATGSSAHGNAVFVLANDGSSMSYKLIVNGLSNTTMAHIHIAPNAGGDGPIALWLYPDAPPPNLIAGIFNGLLGSRTVTSADLVNSSQHGVDSLKTLRTAIEEGRAYVNVHTTENPAGEIRGDIH